MRMRAWFLISLNVAILAWFLYAFFRSDLCAWVNETPSADGCAELFQWWVHPAITFIPSLSVFVVGLLRTRSGPYPFFAWTAVYAFTFAIQFTIFFIVLGVHTGPPPPVLGQSIVPG